ncbi:MAG: hypothetical protein ACI4D2_10435 [Lachnospiraceae bacterium]
MLAIITGTIRPTNLVTQLKIRNEEERLFQYLESLKFFIESKAFTKIIFCENSNYGAGGLAALEEMARDNGVKLEILSFQGDIQQVERQGKGYGEGEILDYVFDHSDLVEREPFFIKITGRMKVMNIQKLVSAMKPEKSYFNVPNSTLRTLYDTRIYGMPTEQFKRCFREVYHKVWDNQGIYLEHIYTQTLKENGIKVTNFPRYPRIVGISGSTGGSYTYVEWKCKIKDIFSRLNGYRVRG